MRAAWYDRPGPARSVLRISELDDPHPRSGEVRVAVAFAGVNPSDAKRRMSAANGVRVIPGGDAAGFVDEIGDGVPATRLGERVWVYGAGTQSPSEGSAAEKLVVRSERAVPLSASVNLKLGASLGAPTLTAAATLFDGPTIEGRVVLAAAGAGGVGRAVVEIAAASGAIVIATVSSEDKADVARRAGAHYTINYRDPEAAEHVLDLTNGSGVDLIAEVDLHANLDFDFKVAATRARLVAYGSSDTSTSIPFSVATRKILAITWLWLYGLPQEMLSAYAQTVNTLLDTGRFTSTPLQVFPLTNIVDAHEAIETGHTTGKLIVDVNQDLR
jgi:NADPH:quinone reductase